jgi:hypothetical protein
LGKLVKFDQRPRPAATSEGRRPGDAQILIFTGVRYERATTPVLPDTRLDPTRPKRKRG